MEIMGERTMISKELLLEAAKRKGLTNKEHIEKDYYQDLFLFHIYKQTNLLVFKGGTALYKFYQLPRFSEDLDFSVLQQSDIKAILFLTVEKIPHAKISEVKEMRESILCKIRCPGIITAGNTIRIDISTDNPVLSKFEVKNYIPPYIDINPFAARVMNIQEIIAEKIHALLARQKSRDVYDLFFILRFTTLDKELVLRKLNHFGMKFDIVFIQKRIQNLAPVWKAELGVFILGELPDFEVVRDFVVEKLS